MPKISSTQWDEEMGACALHGIPCVPCPQCLAVHHEDIWVYFNEYDRTVAEWEDIPLVDLLPIGCEWLMDRR